MTYKEILFSELLVILRTNANKSKNNFRWDSSVSIVSANRLDNRGSIPGRSEGFFSLASVSRPALRPTQPMRYRGSFSWVKALPRRDVDHYPHLVPRSRMSRSFFPLPLGVCMVVAGQLCLFLLYFHKSCLLTSPPPHQKKYIYTIIQFTHERKAQVTILLNCMQYEIQAVK
jgi:hypothetical protein